MNPNPILKRLGFSDTDRVVILHADDIGMCQSTLVAYDDLLRFGFMSSAAVMAPCPWFPLTAEYCRKHPNVDMGVHLTLTCEWEGYRWGPVSTRDVQSGLLDSEGYFPRTNEPVQVHATTEAVQAELQAQVDKAITAGIQVTHIDTHMGTVLHPKFMAAYAMTAFQYKLPLLIPRLDEAGFMAFGADAETAATAVEFVKQMEYSGLPLHDGISSVDLDKPDNRIEQYKQVFDALPCGLSRIYFHPSVDSPETRAISPDWRARVADYQSFLSQELCDYVQKLGIQVIGYQALKEVMAG